MEAIILAGGLGTRLRSVVPDLPKPMAPISGKPFLAYLLDYWIKQGVERFIFAVGYKHEVIQKYFGNKYKHVEIKYEIETEPLGTGGGVLKSARQLLAKSPFLILNGDTFFAVNYSELLKHHLNHCADMTLSLIKVSKNDRYGSVLLDQSDRVCTLETQNKQTENLLINGGVYLVQPNLLNAYQGELEASSLENDLLPELLNKDKLISGFLASGKFIDIGVPEDYYQAELLLSDF